MKIINAILCALMAMLSCPEKCYLGAVEVQVHEPIETQMDELEIIARAAERNNCRGDDFLILLAIRRAENGGPGREFGIKHRLCRAAIEREPQRSLDIQAGWAAATIVKNRCRWEFAGRPGEFIDFLGDRYCPASVDSKGNKNWKINVKYFYNKFLEQQE
ncbi:MAG: hypothetical protein ABSG99_02865 [Sedimentisphaerales bacterium]